MKKLLLTFVFLVFPYTAFAAVCASQSLTTGTQDQWPSPGQSQLAQPFTVSQACVLTTATIRILAHGSPSGGQYAITTDTSGHPGTLLEKAAFTGVTSSFSDVSATFSGTVTLNTGTTYWLVSTSTGSEDAANDYFYAINSSGPGTYGFYYFYTDSTGLWAPNSPWTTAAFEIDGTAPVVTTPFNFDSWWEFLFE